MIQAKILLPVDGKTDGSFATLDLMRMPLGILTGVGFIGGGAILKKGSSIRGLTTAATLWIATTIGLSFGGGQIFLGIIGTFLGSATLVGLSWIERNMTHRREAKLIIATNAVESEPDLKGRLLPLRCEVRRVAQKRGLPSFSDETENHYRLHDGLRRKTKISSTQYLLLFAA